MSQRRSDGHGRDGARVGGSPDGEGGLPPVAPFGREDAPAEAAPGPAGPRPDHDEVQADSGEVRPHLGGAPPDPPWPPRPEGWRHDAPDPPDAFPVPWSVSDAFLLVLWTVLAQMIVGGVALGLGTDLTRPGLTTALVFLAIQVVVALGGVAWLAGRGRLSWRILGPLRPRVRDLAVGVGVGVAGFLIVTVSVVLAEQLAGRVEAPEEPLRELAVEGGLPALLTVVLVAVILAPALEEVIFRGLLFQGLRQRLGLFPAMGISALVFGAVHLPKIVQPDGSLNMLALPSIVALAILGFWFAGAFHRTGRLGVVVAAHGAFNGIALLILTLT